MSLVVRRSEANEFRKRFRWIALGMALIFVGLLARLFQLQILDSDENRLTARENIQRRVTLATTRGVIRDRTGKILAASRPAYNVYVVPERFARESKKDTEYLGMKTRWPRLVDYLGLGTRERDEKEQKLLALLASTGARKNQLVLLKEDASRDAVANLATHESEFPGVEVVPVPVRYYPYEEIGAHVLGYMAEVDGDRLAQLHGAGYMEGDRIGASGTERAWESYLRGTRGWEKVLVDAKGRKRHGDESILEEPRRSDPIPGRDLRLTIDAELEKAMEAAFRPQLAGGVALIDVRTGRILGLYSKPSFDPNTVSGGSGREVIKDAFRRMYDPNDRLRPALDKTISGAYPPGSTFKPFTALAALEKGLIDPHAVTQCHGAITFGRRVFRCTHNHGAVDLHRAIAESCNVYFFTLAAEYGVGMDVIAEMGLRYGMGAKTGLGINAEAPGRMPTKAWMTLRNKGHFQQGYALNAAIGQGATTVSVLQLALAYAALANGGTLYQPQLVRAVETSNGTVVQEFSPRVRRQIELRPENLALVQKALIAGVNEVGGTAYRAIKELKDVDLAGKTGTAQVSHKVVRGAEAEKVWYYNREHAWFAGYAPTKSPEVAVVVLVEHGGGGGKNAAPIAGKVVRAYQELMHARKDAHAQDRPPHGTSTKTTGGAVPARSGGPP